MDGKTALCWVRERKTTNDLARSCRQQEVMIGIFDKICM